MRELGHLRGQLGHYILTSEQTEKQAPTLHRLAKFSRSTAFRHPEADDWFHLRRQVLLGKGGQADRNLAELLCDVPNVLDEAKAEIRAGGEKERSPMQDCPVSAGVSSVGTLTAADSRSRLAWRSCEHHVRASHRSNVLCADVARHGPQETILVEGIQAESGFPDALAPQIQ